MVEKILKAKPAKRSCCCDRVQVQPPEEDTEKKGNKKHSPLSLGNIRGIIGK